MIDVDTERLHTAQLLYGLAERMKLERDRTTRTATRRALEYCIELIELAAIDTAVGAMSLDDADAIADAGELTYRRLRGTPS